MKSLHVLTLSLILGVALTSCGNSYNLTFTDYFETAEEGGKADPTPTSISLQKEMTDDYIELLNKADDIEKAYAPLKAIKFSKSGVPAGSLSNPFFTVTVNYEKYDSLTFCFKEDGLVLFTNKQNVRLVSDYKAIDYSFYLGMIKK